VAEWCEHDDYPSGSIKRGKFPDYLKNNSLSSMTLHLQVVNTKAVFEMTLANLLPVFFSLKPLTHLEQQPFSWIHSMWQDYVQLKCTSSVLLIQYTPFSRGLLTLPTVFLDFPL
jgi:hypothetical protein